MSNRRKVWLGVGLFALAGSSVVLPGAPSLAAGPSASSDRSGAGIAPHDRLPLGSFLLAEGGEGGEAGGEGGGGREAGMAVESYSLNSTDPNDYKYEAAPEIAAYAAGVYASYRTAAAEAKNLQAAVDALLADPSEATLAAARSAWIKARPAYLVTEAFRFYDGPIEDIEGQINAWPLNEAFIDYVVGKPQAGIVNDPSAKISIEDIIGKNQVTDENDVTTGWHAVEFLLWGQDLDPDGPGARPAGDYLPGKGNNGRRREYLKLVTDQLAADIATVAEGWKPGSDNYAARFRALPEREAIGRIMNGMAVLAGFEFMSERLAVALDSGDQEDEHSCFSDTTHQDFVYDLKGIENVWNGTYPGAAGPGIAALLARIDPDLAKTVNGLLADATAKVAALGDPWDKVLAAPPESPERQAAEDAVSALRALGDGLKKAGAKLGVLVQIPAG